MAYHEKPTYDAFDYNGGVPPEPNAQWSSGTKAWEWTDISVNPAFIPVDFPEEVKKALTNNICIICGEKNCPYIRNFKSYRQLVKALQRGNKSAAKRIYTMAFASLRGTNKGAVEAGLEKARKASEGKRLQPVLFFPRDVVPLKVRNVWALPFLWGPWTELVTQVGDGSYTVRFYTISQLPSSFSAQIEYSTLNGIKRVNTLGPGSYKIVSDGGAAIDRIRFKSHSFGQAIRVEFR